MVWQITLIVVGGLVVTWLTLIVVLAIAQPDSRSVSELARLVPDTIKLVRRLASDRSICGVRLRLAFLLAYLMSPIDLIPDFIPLIGYADDILVTALVLRSVARKAGPDALERHWPGTPSGFAALTKLCRLPMPTSEPEPEDTRTPSPIDDVEPE